MIFRGAQIQRDGHGECGLLLKQTLSSNTAELSSSGVLAPTGMTLHNVWPRMVTSNREVQHVTDRQGRNLFHVTRAGCLGTPAGGSHSLRNYNRSHVGRLVFEWALVECSDLRNQRPRQDAAIRSQCGLWHGSVKARGERTRAVHA